VQYILWMLVGYGVSCLLVTLVALVCKGPKTAWDYLLGRL